MDLEQALAELETLKGELKTAKGENEKLAKENVSLKATKQGLMTDLKKKKSVDAFLKVAGIELSPETSEEEIAEQIAALKAPAPASAVASSEPAASSTAQGGEQASTGQQQSNQQPQGQATPSDAMNAAVNAELQALKKQNESLVKMVSTIEKERDEEREQRRQAKLERKVLDELARPEVKCIRPSHLLKLERDNFDILDDETVVYKVGDDMLPLRDAIAKLKEDSEYSPYFGGSGATGSGLPPSRTTSTVATNNPFATGTVNATEAAKLFNENPDKAKQLISQAQGAGKLDPTMARVFGQG